MIFRRMWGRLQASGRLWGCLSRALALLFRTGQSSGAYGRVESARTRTESSHPRQGEAATLPEAACARHPTFAAGVGCPRERRGSLGLRARTGELECSPPTTSWTGGTIRRKSSLLFLSSDPIPLPLKKSTHFFRPGSARRSIEFRRLHSLPSWRPSPRRDRCQPVSCAS